MQWQMRQKLASGMGVGHQDHDEAGYWQAKTFPAKALSHCLGGSISNQSLKVSGSTS